MAMPKVMNKMNHRLNRMEVMLEALVEKTLTDKERRELEESLSTASEGRIAPRAQDPATFDPTTVKESTITPPATPIQQKPSAASQAEAVRAQGRGTVPPPAASIDATPVPHTTTQEARDLATDAPPFKTYEKATVAETLREAKNMDDEGRARLLAYERTHKNRDGVIEPLVNWNS